MVGNDTATGLMRPVLFFDQLTAHMDDHKKFVEPGKPQWLNPELRVDDLYTIVLAAAVLFAMKVMYISFAEYKFFPNLKYKVRRKLFEQLFLVTFHSAVFIFGAYTLAGEDWTWKMFTNSNVDLAETFFRPFPPPMSPRFRAFYATQIGFYLGAMCALFIDTRRRDFREYIIHHFATLTLTSASFVFSMVRLGLCILLLHDLSDIFLAAAKSAHYIMPGIADTVLFVVFSIAFYVGRLIIYPRIVWTVVIEIIWYCGMKPDFNRWVAYFDTYLTLWFVMACMLMVILLLNAFWMAIILVMLFREVTGTGSVREDGDDRSDGEDED